MLEFIITRIGIRGAAILAVLAALIFQHLWIGDLKTDIEKLKADKIILQTSVNNLTVSLDNQNASILAWRDQGAVKSANAATLVAAARINSLKYASLAGMINGIHPAGDECSQVKDIIDNYFNWVKP